MEDKDVNRIRNYVDLKQAEEVKGLLIAAIIISLTMPFMLFCMGFKYHFNVFKSVWLIFYFLYFFTLIFDLYILHDIYKRQVEFILFNSILAITTSSQFLASYYFIGKNIVGIKLQNLILGFIVVAICYLALLYYRIRIYKGLSKNRSGSPNYNIIITASLVGGGIGTSFLTKTFAISEDFLLTIFCWFIGLAMGVGFVSIHQYYIAKRYKEIIVLFQKPIPKKKRTSIYLKETAENINMQSTPDYEENIAHKKIDKKKIIVGGTIAVIITIMFFAITNISYEKAIGLMDTGKYQDAAKRFQEISWYRDSGELTLKNQYELAIEYFNQGNYQKASDLFKSLCDYRDSPEKFSACASLIDGSSDKNHNSAVAAEDSANPDEELAATNNWSGTWEMIVTLDDGTKDYSKFSFDLEAATVTWDTEPNDEPYIYPLKIVNQNTVEFYQPDSIDATDRCVYNSDGTITRTFLETGQTYLLTKNSKVYTISISSTSPVIKVGESVALTINHNCPEARVFLKQEDYDFANGTYSQSYIWEDTYSAFTLTGLTAGTSTMSFYYQAPDGKIITSEIIPITIYD